MGGFDRERGRRVVRETVAICAVVAVGALALYVAGIGCPIKFATGISCPGCGLTRAWLEALQLHFDRAVAYHPLFWLVPVAFIVGAVHTYSGGRVTLAFLAIMVVALMVLWAVRMADPCDLSLLTAAAGEGDVVNVSSPGWVSVLGLL